MTLIVPLSQPLIPSLTEMIQKQQQWHHALDPRLPVRSEQEIASCFQMQIGSGLVALTDCEEVCGYGHPGVRQGRAQELLSPFQRAGQVGVVRQLTLHPERETAKAAEGLLFALTQMWNFQSREADLICWPVCDSRLGRVLLAQRFQLEKVGTFASSASLFTHQDFCPSSIPIRPINREDREAVLDWYGEELEYQGMHSPFVRPDQGALDAFCKHLEHLFSFSGEPLEEGVLRVLVAEREGRLVSMICFHHFTNTASMHLEYLPPGRYGSLDLISVSAELLELDIGRHLVQAAITHLDPLSLDGLLHCYQAQDPLAPSFWRRQGFFPLWTSYGRLAAAHER